MSVLPNITKKLSNYCSHDLGLNLPFKTMFDCLTRASFLSSSLPRFNYESDSNGKPCPVAFKYWRDSTRQFEKGFLFDCERPIRGRECLPCRSCLRQPFGEIPAISQGFQSNTFLFQLRQWLLSR